MRTENIQFQDRRTPIVFPLERSDLAQAISTLRLEDGHPVIVLIGGEIDEHQAAVTSRAIQTISMVAEEMNAVVICGGTDMGVMAEIGQLHSQNQDNFPLVGIAPEDLVSWPGGLRSTRFLFWGKRRWALESHYSHFILVPGHDFGDESPWIGHAAVMLSKGHRSVTILINGGDVSRKDIELSLAMGRPVIALSHTGRLADELSRQVNRNKLITVVPANVEHRIVEAIETALLIRQIGDPVQLLKKEPHRTLV